MNEEGIRFMVSGHDAQEASADIRRILKEELDYEAPVQQEQGAQDTTKAFDPVSVGGLILALPGAVLAAMDVKDRIQARMRKKQKLEKTMERINREVTHKRETTVKIQYPDGTVKETTTVETTELLNQLTD